MEDRDRNSVEAAIVDSLRKGREDTPLIRRLLKDNQLLKHNYGYCHERQSLCALEGCSQEFSFVLVPGQIIYPKYCEQHRNSYQRERFIRNRVQNAKCKMQSDE